MAGKCCHCKLITGKQQVIWQTHLPDCYLSEETNWKRRLEEINVFNIQYRALYRKSRRASIVKWLCKWLVHPGISPNWVKRLVVVKIGRLWAEGLDRRAGFLMSSFGGPKSGHTLGLTLMNTGGCEGGREGRIIWRLKQWLTAAQRAIFKFGPQHHDYVTAVTTAFDLPADLHSIPHPWPWALGSDWKNGNESLLHREAWLTLRDRVSSSIVGKNMI